MSRCHVGADGSVFEKYPHFRQRNAAALREILDWDHQHRDDTAKDDDGDGDGAKTSGMTGRKAKEEDPIVLHTSEDGSGVGAAVVAALTLKRVKEGNLAGVKNAKGID